ncbi:MAG: nucleotidyltransferase substrate binding protein [Gammaproteobacteria bacterium]|nr:nucleotidyltransferase substrate binding protein [Gammaproteobacteria bacterium]
MIDHTRFRLSLKRLEEQYDNHHELNSALPEFILEAIAESVTRRFKFCYDCLWKTLKRHLVEKLGYPDPPNSPKPLFRIAHENGLLPSPVEQWLQYADARTNLLHDCDGEKAKACLLLMPGFIDDAIDLYQTMTELTWTTDPQGSQ